MAKNVTKDLTHGSVMKLILGFAIPMLMGLLFQQFYNMVDTIIVGKWLGVDSLAAVGSTGSINFMIVGFCIGVCSGFAIPVSQQFGAGDMHSLRKYVANAAKLSVVMSIVITIVVCLLCRNILEWMKTPENIIDEAYNYIFVIFLGIPVTFLYNMLSGIIRAMGDSKTPVVFLVISSILNIALDIISIRVFKMGVIGPALATVVAQLVSGILCLIYMNKKYDTLKISRDEWRTDRVYMRKLLSMGLPMGLQYSITAIGSVVLQTSVNGLGSKAVAAVAAGGKVSMFFCCTFDALGATMATYAGQNVGARKMNRVGQGMMSAIIIGAVYSLAAFGILYAFGDKIALLFMDKDQVELLDRVHQFLIINSMFYIPLTLVNVVRFCIQGMGFSNLAILAGVCEMIARSVVGFGMVPLLGYTAVCFANPLAWIMADLFLIPAYIFCIRKLCKTFGVARGTSSFKSRRIFMLKKV